MGKRSQQRVLFCSDSVITVEMIDQKKNRITREFSFSADGLTVKDSASCWLCAWLHVADICEHEPQKLVLANGVTVLADSPWERFEQPYAFDYGSKYNIPAFRVCAKDCITMDVRI